MPEATFDDLLSWLQEHVGLVLLEVGAHSAGNPDAVTLVLRVAMIGIEPATNVETPEAMAVMVRLGAGRAALYLEPARVARVVVVEDSVKVWFNDGMYVALVG